MNINPPPSDKRCDCCERHTSELTPFGGPGDPLVGDFRGALLVKRYRPAGPYDEEATNAFREDDKRCEEDGHKDALEWLRAKYGDEKTEEKGSQRAVFFAGAHSILLFRQSCGVKK